MAPKPTGASRWRIEFAQELSTVYSKHEHVKMVLLGGSPSRGIADRFSDIDMVVYWDEIDSAFIAEHPLTKFGGEFRFFLPGDESGGGMELYYFEKLIYEVGHLTLASWEELTAAVLTKHEISPPLLKSIEGFLDAQALYGAELHENLKQPLRIYPEPVARKIVQNSLGFYWHGCLVNQGLERGDLIFFYDGITMTLKRLLGILAALNHQFFSAAEPRWIEFELSRMSIKPVDMWPRIVAIFDGARSEAVPILESLIEDVIKLVVQHMPDLSFERFNLMQNLEISACDHRPLAD